MEADQQIIDGSEVESEANKLEPTAEDKITEGEDLLAEAKDGEDKDNETEVTTGQEEHNESVPVPEELDNEETPINDQSQPTTITIDESKSDIAMMPSIIISGEDLVDDNNIQQQVPTSDDMSLISSERDNAITPVPGETDIIQSRILNQDEEEDNVDHIKPEDELQPSQLDDIVEEEDSEEDSEEEFDRDEAIDHYKVLLSEFEKSQSNHSHLQHKIAEYLAKKKVDDKPDPSRNVTDQEQRYQKCMDALDQLQNESKGLMNDFETEEEQLKKHHKIKQDEIQKAWKLFSGFVKDKAVTAVHSRTGRKLSSQEIDQYLGMLERKDKDVNQVKLENVKLQNRMNKLETLIQQKEQLAEGLHMIDFEQLRINNVDLNEKIEDRNEEIHKLQKKVTSTIQVLAHLKEKLQFVQTQNTHKEKQLKELDQDVAKKRDGLNRLKHAKDAVRNENTQLKQRGGLVSHPVLLKDFEQQIDLRESMQAKLQDIQQRHSELTLLCNTLKQKIDSARVLPL